MNLDRTKAPPFNALQNLVLPIAEKIMLTADIPLYVVNSGNEPIAKIDVVFNAGLTKELYKAEAIFTAAMLSEGTKNRSGKELASALDFYGSYFEVKSNADDSVATLYCLNKHLTNTLPLFFEALFLSVIPEKELKITKDNAVQKLRVNLKKNSFLARMHFYEHVFGENHPYSVNYNEADINSINRDKLSIYFNANYKNGVKYMFASGKIEHKEVTATVDEFLKWPFGTNNNSGNFTTKTLYGKHFYKQPKSVQSAIKIGMPTITRKHPDYVKLQIFNLLFGGYFGSRLMKNIREEKGLTYGIYATLESFTNSGCWYISTELNNPLRDRGLAEIYKEIESVKTTGFSKSELSTGKKYFLGSILRGIDGAFSIAERNKIIIDFNLNNNYYSELVNTIETTNNKDLIEVANKHITQNLVEVVVGA